MRQYLKVTLLTGGCALALAACQSGPGDLAPIPPGLQLVTEAPYEEDILSELDPPRDLLMQHPDPDPVVVDGYVFKDRVTASVAAAFRADIERAIRECNRPAYDRAVDRWVRHRYDPRVQGGQVRPNDPDMQEDLQTLRRVYDERPAFPEDCDGALQRAQVELRAWGGLESIRLPTTKFLGWESAGTPQVGLVSPARTDEDGRLYGGWLAYPLNSRLRSQVGGVTLYAILGLGSEYYDLDEDFEEIDLPTPGARMLIPGPEGGPSGYSLGGYPANLVYDGFYRLDQDRHGVRFGLARQVPTANGVFGSSVTVRYGWGQSHETFGGRIPGFGRDFQYDTPVDLRQVQIRAGVDYGNHPFIGGDALRRRPPGLLWHLTASAGPAFNEGDGVDWLRFTGMPDSRRDLHEESTDWGGHAAVRLGWWFDDVRVEGEVRYERRTGYPVVDRNGEDPSRLSLESADAWAILIGARLDF